MNHNLSCIMLVDDNEADNYLHKMVIEEANCTNQIVVMLNGKEAIAYLQENLHTPQFPELIFLDINMPVMNGWEFLDAYAKAGYNKKTSSIVAMLTTSINPDDFTKAQQKEVVADFTNKPLTSEKLDEILRNKMGNLFD